MHYFQLIIPNIFDSSPQLSVTFFTVTQIEEKRDNLLRTILPVFSSNLQLKKIDQLY